MDQLFAKNCAEESTENRNPGFERSCHSKDRRPRARRNESRRVGFSIRAAAAGCVAHDSPGKRTRSEEHTSELQSQSNLVCRLLLEKKKKTHPHARVDHTTQLKSKSKLT